MTQVMHKKQFRKFLENLIHFIALHFAQRPINEAFTVSFSSRSYLTEITSFYFTPRQNHFKTEARIVTMLRHDDDYCFYFSSCSLFCPSKENAVGKKLLTFYVNGVLITFITPPIASHDDDKVKRKVFDDVERQSKDEQYEEMTVKAFKLHH
ncbi:CLUMA_CG010198, isoform A [Clunio marinus]|uniref:CLUMA_CG010198, isoform A n=1 Tax=Clunio marinus TaxID=568069 RepID=A0A1J1ICA0_9DIPT|nr:CLUMA_CG010198, isoform A [Clunio marinus]